MWDLGGLSISGTGDFNGDGLDDVLLRATNGSITAWLGQEGGGFVSSGHTVSPGSTVLVVGTGDFNGDGRDDVLLRTSIGYTTAWLGQADGGFVSSGRTLSLGAGWNVGATGDFNGDGRDDLFMQSTYGQHADWLGQADGGFVNSGATIAIRGNRTDSSDHWFVKGGGDFNGDGRSDVLWGNTSTGALDIWQGAANGGVVAASSTNTGLAVAGTGDFDGDGRTDVLLSDGSGHLSYMAGTATGLAAAVSLTSDKGTGWHVAGTGDFDSDGRVDFLWANSTNFDTQLNVADVPPPTPQELWAAALAEVQAFFDQLTSEADQFVANGGGDQNSYYNDGDYWQRLFEAEAFYAIFSEPNSSGQSFADQLGADGWTLDMTGYTASLTSGDYTLNLLDPSDNSFLFNSGNTLLVGQLHQGDPPPSDPNAILITAPANGSPSTYFTFNPTDSGFGFVDGHITSGPETGTGPAAVHIDGTPTERTDTLAALSLLYKYSPTAHALIDAILASGIGIKAGPASLDIESTWDHFDKDRNWIIWDPFLAFEGRNLDGTLYDLSPLMCLAHELVHAGHAGDPLYNGSEAEGNNPAFEVRVMQVANQIASEMNANAHTSYDTSRDNHSGATPFYTPSPTSFTYTLVRPGG